MNASSEEWSDEAAAAQALAKAQQVRALVRQELGLAPEGG